MEAAAQDRTGWSLWPMLHWEHKSRHKSNKSSQVKIECALRNNYVEAASDNVNCNIESLV